MVAEGAVISVAALGSYLWAMKRASGHASTQAFLTVTLSQLLQALNMNSGRNGGNGGEQSQNNPMLKWTVVIGIALIFIAIYSPGLRVLLGNSKIGLGATLRSTALAGVAMVANRWLRKVFDKNKSDYNNPSIIDVQHQFVRKGSETARTNI